jgi:non-ribosomal peptide synthetase component F
MFENHQMLDYLQQQSECWQHRTIALDEQPSFPLVLIAGLGEQLQLKISVDRTRFDPATIAWMVYDAQHLTYNELNQRSNQLAHLLVERGGCGKGGRGLRAVGTELARWSGAANRRIPGFALYDYSRQCA